MKYPYFILLLIFGASAKESVTALCKLTDSQCYVECDVTDKNCFKENNGNCLKLPKLEKQKNRNNNNFNKVEREHIKQQMKFDFNGPNKICEYENFTMIVLKMNMMNTTGDRHVKISAPKLFEDDPPIDVFIPTEPFQNVSNEQLRVSVVMYHSAEQFINDSYPVLKSKVIRVETVEDELKNLSNRLVINFTMKCSEIIPENQMLSCQFYNETEYAWSDIGSFTNLSNFNCNKIVTCSYDHMTPFAVLLVDMKVTQIDSKQWKILSYISYIGCSFSAFFSAITILFYMFMKSSKRDNSLGIHVSLSAALFILNTSFLFNEWGATLSRDTLCVLIAVIIQYSLLSCFSWMAIEAIHLYLLLIKVYNTYIKYYMVKLSLFGWGVPAVLVGGSLCVYGSKPLYGTIQITSLDTNETTSFCWITDTNFLYGLNITYLSLTFLFNTCILVAVTHQIFKMRQLNVSGKNHTSHKDICIVLGLTVLLGTTWGLAFFTSGYTNYPVLYLFCICNTLQGLFLFLWFYGTMKRNRSLEAQNSTLSQPTSTIVNSYESSFTQ